MSDFAIERNVPLPANAGKSGRPSKYPFRDMRIGDSFFVEGADKKQSARIGASAIAALGKGKVTRRVVDGGVRVWRIA